MPKINPDSVCAQETYTRIKRLKERKPFTKCYQCCNSKYNMNRELICHRPNQRGRTIPADKLIIDCPDAKRYEIKDALNPSTLQALGKEIMRTSRLAGEFRKK